MSTTEQEVMVVVSPGGRTRPLRELLEELGVPMGGGEDDAGAQFAALQAQVDELRADTQRKVDELRNDVLGAEPQQPPGEGAEPAAAAVAAKPRRPRRS